MAMPAYTCISKGWFDIDSFMANSPPSLLVMGLLELVGRPSQLLGDEHQGRSVRYPFSTLPSLRLPLTPLNIFFNGLMCLC